MYVFWEPFPNDSSVGLTSQGCSNWKTKCNDYSIQTQKFVICHFFVIVVITCNKLTMIIVMAQVMVMEVIDDSRSGNDDGNNWWF